MRKRLTQVVSVLAILMILSASACDLNARQTESTRNHMTVEEFYQSMASELKRNPTRLKSLEGKKTQPFGGRITKIDGTSIQFVVDSRRFRRDHYVTCSFRTTSDVLSLNVEDYVVIEGILEVAFPNRVPFFDEVGAVKLRDCNQVARR